MLVDVQTLQLEGDFVRQNLGADSETELQQTEADFYQRMEADFEVDHLLEADPDFGLGIFEQLEAVFDRQHSEAAFSQQLVAVFLPDIGLDKFFGMIECCGSIAVLVPLGNLEQG